MRPVICTNPFLAREEALKVPSSPTLPLSAFAAYRLFQRRLRLPAPKISGLGYHPHLLEDRRRILRRFFGGFRLEGADVEIVIAEDARGSSAIIPLLRYLGRICGRFRDRGAQKAHDLGS
jgi:hypothetical protein